MQFGPKNRAGRENDRNQLGEQVIKIEEKGQEMNGIQDIQKSSSGYLGKSLFQKLWHEIISDDFTI